VVSDSPSAVTVTPPSAGSYYFRKGYQWDKWGYYNEWEDYDIYVSDFAEAVDSLKNAFSQNENISYYYISLYWSGYLYEGSNSISDQIYVSYEEQSPDQIFYIPILTWDADSFGDWVLPDPTFNGLFPDVITDAEFKRIFGIEADNWEKTIRFDW